MFRILVIFLLLVPVGAVAAAESDVDPWAALQAGRFDEAEAVWLPRAENGEVAAQLFLGHLETMRDRHRAAANWYRRAASRGDATAQTLLATLYLQGRGVIRDPVKAYAWYELASAQGHANASRARDAAALQMSEADIEEAKELARTWLVNGTPAYEDERSDGG